MNETQKSPLRKLFAIIALTLGGMFATAGDTALAQIIPDGTLGAESSAVTIVAPQVEQIDGGAIRGGNLFHSFEDFNVNEGWAANFANPTGIENILSRVTGNNSSDIYGALGVLGDANLFLLNPNGIIFGPNAELNINGSFYASTADSFLFPDGGEFSAANPGDAALLSVNVPLGVQYGPNAPGAITNEGLLSVGQDFRLSGGSVDSTGLLSAPAGELRVEGVAGDVQIANAGAQTATFSASNNLILQESQLQTVADLNLFAGNTVQMRDSAANPLIAFAGEDLTVQGNQNVDIFVLNHPSSGLVSGGNMVLRSANAVGGDAHYWTGGDFRIEQLDGDLGNLFSPYDPIINANGNVTLGDYTGASLHIFAGGSVTAGNIWITQQAEPGDGFIGQIELSDPNDILSSEHRNRTINSERNPTLDIRAGITEDALATLLNSTPSSEGIFTATEAEDANITISSIRVASFEGRPARVLLTNQYSSNQSDGSIQIQDRVPTLTQDDIREPTSISAPGGSVFIDSRGDISVNNGINVDIAAGDGGEILLLSGGNINTRGLISTASGNGNGRDIIFSAGGMIDTRAGSIETEALNGQAGNVTLRAPLDIHVRDIEAASNHNNTGPDDFNTIEIISTQGSVFIDGANLTTSNFASGLAGTIVIDANNKIRIINNSTISSKGDSGLILIESSFEGDPISSQEIIIENQSIIIENSELTTSNENEVDEDIVDEDIVDENIEINAGDIIIRSDGNILLRDSQLSSNAERRDSTEEENGITTIIERRGDSGNINIRANSLTLDNGADLSVSTNGTGNGGLIAINADNLVNIEGTGTNIFNQVNSRATGKGGNIEINTGTLEVSGGALILARNNGGIGDAGSINITATGTAMIAGFERNPGIAIVASDVRDGGTGNGGPLTIKARSIIIDNNAIVAASIIDGQGQTIINERGEAVITPAQAGNITLEATERVDIKNDSVVVSEIGSTSVGSGGTINILAPIISIDRASVNTQIRRGGNAQIGEGFEGRAGDIIISAFQLLKVRGGGQLSTITLGQGDAGNISIRDSQNVIFEGEGENRWSRNRFISGRAALDSSGAFASVESTATGNAGGITIEADSLSLTNGAELSARTAGQGRAGDINITANTLEANGGGQILADTTTSSNAGDIILTFSDNVSLTGENTGLFATTSGAGQAGSITITGPHLTLSDEAQISVEATGQGQAGNLVITAEFIELDNGELTANTNSGTGGNIGILSPNPENPFVILMRNGSLISAQAAGEADGGNIVINIARDASGRDIADTDENGRPTISDTADLVIDNQVNGNQVSDEVALIQENNEDLQTGFILADRNNNDILATADRGRGGNIIANVFGIFGLEERNLPPGSAGSPIEDNPLRRNATSDISVSSRLGFPGNFLNFELNIDPTQGLGDLPIDLTNVSELVAEGCVGTDRSGVDTQGELTRTGRGGFSPDPTGVLTDDALLDQSTPNPADQSGPDSSAIPDNSNQPLVEAQGLARDESGKVSLVTDTFASPAASPISTSFICDAP